MDSFNATISGDRQVLSAQQVKLIQSCIKGDRNAQRRVYGLLSPKMFAVCLRYSKTREEAEDILQDGFIQVFGSLKNFKHQGSFEGWVRKIMVNCCIQHFRSRIRMLPVVSMESYKCNDVLSDDVFAQMGKKELFKMVQSLPTVYRMVFNLYVFEGMKHREIALHLGISEGTSKSNLFDAKIILQKAVINSLKVAT